MGGDDAGHGLGRALHIGENGHTGAGSLGRRHQLEHGLRNDPQGALGLDHQPGQIVARDALDRTRTGLDQRPRGIKKFHAHKIVFGHAIFEPAQAAGVFRNIAADGGHRLRAGVRRIKQIFFGHRSGELGGNDARLHHGVEVVGIDFKNAVEARGQDHHRVGLVRNGAAGKVGAGTPHGHGDAVVIELFHALAQLLCRGGPHHQRGHHCGQHRGIIRIARAVGFRAEHIFLAQQILKILDQRLACHRASLCTSVWS